MMAGSQKSDDPGRIEGVTEEFMVCLTRAAKDAQADEKHCYHCSSPEHFICNCPLVKTSRDKKHLNGKEGMALIKGAQTSQTMTSAVKSPQTGGSLRHKNYSADSLLESRALFSNWYGVKNIAKVRINGESCMALLDNGAQINTIMLRYPKWSFVASGAHYWPHRCQSHLWGVGQCLHKTIGLHSNLGSGRQSSGLWWGSDRPSNPRQF